MNSKRWCSGARLPEKEIAITAQPPRRPMPKHTEKRLRLIASLSQGERILDIGWVHSPNYWLRGDRIVGLDRDPRPMEPPYTEIVQGDVFAESSSLDGQIFDTVICGEFIEHVEEPYRLLRRLRTLLAPEGRLQPH